MRRVIAVVFLLCALLAGAATSALAQPAASAGSPARLRVFLDCHQCDLDYLRQNVGWVDYMRDRADADLHVLVTVQGTGSGGLSWNALIIGLGRFAGHDHAHTFTTPQTATSDDHRREFARVFQLALVDYAAGSPLMAELNITWRRPAAAGPAEPQDDPWDYWVFRSSAGGSSSGERQNTSSSYRVSFSANRVTEAWKISLSGNSDINRSEFEVSESTKVRSRRDSWSTNGLVVKSLGPKWSLGGRVSLSHSSFSNTDRALNIAPGIEYDFFPYSESSRRSLTVQYTVGVLRNTYREITVFDKLADTVPNHAVSLSLGLRQPWGSVGAQASYQQHLNNTDRYRASFFGNTDVRLFKGFSFNVFASYNKINDQISLPKGGATRDEILLRLRQLATNYSYSVHFGISYSFGSIFNNIVNPRFGGGGGEVFFFF